MKSFEVVTIGSALKDIMFHSDDVALVADKKNLKNFFNIEAGRKFSISDVFVNYGGGATNAAVGLNNFGIIVSPMIMLGADQVGQEFYSYLKKNKINTALIEILKKEKTGFSIILSSSKTREHVVFSFKGASDFVRAQNLDEFKTDWFYVSALTNKNWKAEFEKITRQVKRGSRIAWNPGLLQLKDYKTLLKFLPFVEILILNLEEAVDLVSRLNKKAKKSQLNKPVYLLKELSRSGAKKVVVTKGNKGVFAVDELGQYHYYPSVAVTKRVVDTVGAGDAFSSGLIAGMIRWENFSRALQLGIRNSAHVLYRVGAQNGLMKIKL
ncbi:carbohydrate kinase family protein [Patescibacteria group bacterium]|nr:carbohydrate kinase family protein [Patescibacteria group bacterium]